MPINRLRPNALVFVLWKDKTLPFVAIPHPRRPALRPARGHVCHGHAPLFHCLPLRRRRDRGTGIAAAAAAAPRVTLERDREVESENESGAGWRRRFLPRRLDGSRRRAHTVDRMPRRLASRPKRRSTVSNGIFQILQEL
jgi:hypothetical protein